MKKKRHFLIPSLVAAGFSIDHAGAAVMPQDGYSTNEGPTPLFDVLRLAHEYDLAAHRSHSSHGSHRSHRSSSGGRVYPKSSVPSIRRSNPPDAILPRSPATSGRKTLPGHTAKFRNLVRRVQAALFAQGYFTGEIDGIVGTQTRTAISVYQQSHNLTVNGKITTELLNALKITAR